MDITEEVNATSEVLKWKGVHLMYFWFSSCSQKVRIVLGEHNVPYVPKHVDLINCENATEDFLNINKRGVVPVLIHDGRVYVESNEIMKYVDDKFKAEGRSLYPVSAADVDFTEKTLALEDSLHEDMRTLTFGFILPRGLAAKPADKLEQYDRNGPADSGRKAEVEWWQKYALDGVSEEDVKGAFQRYSAAFDSLEARLSDERAFLCGSNLTIADVAWAININRMSLCGFPIARWPKVHKLFLSLKDRPSFKDPLSLEMPMPVIRKVYQTTQWLTGTTLVEIVEGKSSPVTPLVWIGGAIALTTAGLAAALTLKRK